MISAHLRRHIFQTSVFWLAACCSTTRGLATEPGDFNVAYGFSGNSPVRSAVPSSSALAGTLSFGVFPTKSFLIAGSTQTFTGASSPGMNWIWKYGVTKLEFNKDWLISEKAHLQADYTIVLPTNGNNTPGVEHYAHQFLGMLDYQYSDRNYFEIDAGDYLGGRTAAAGFKNTGLLSLIAQSNLAKNGLSPSNLDFEVDASPRSEDTPASAVFSLGMDTTFKSHWTVTALANVGLTANDPAIGFSLRLRYSGNLAKKPTTETRGIFGKLNRLERTRFGRIGRF
jgi:hypothetical protein